MASRTWEPTSSGAPSVQSTCTATRPLRRPKRMHSAWGANADPLRLHDRSQALGDVRISPADDPSALLQDRDVRAELAEGLGEFEADVAADDDDEMQLGHDEKTGIVEGRHVPDTRKLGERRAGPSYLGCAAQKSNIHVHKLPSVRAWTRRDTRPLRPMSSLCLRRWRDRHSRHPDRFN